LATPIEEVEVLLAALRERPEADIAIGRGNAPGARLLKRQSLVRETGGRLFNGAFQMLACRASGTLSVASNSSPTARRRKWCALAD
jgi:hypothetical protein